MSGERNIRPLTYGDMMMKSSLKLEKIQSKIDTLKSQHQKLVEQRHKEITTLVSKANLTDFDDKTLMGGLLHLAQTLTTNPEQKEAWQQAGLTFLRKSKSSKLGSTAA